MAFIVEDGTGVSNANSYVDIAFVDNYFSERGIIAWSGTNEQKQAYCIQATDYINTRWFGMFVSEPQYTEAPAQALPFPRVGLGMPLNLLKATSEYALRAKAAPLASDPTRDPSGYAIQSTKEKVGPIETEFTFAVGAGITPSLLKAYPAADMLMKGLVRAMNNRTYR